MGLFKISIYCNCQKCHSHLRFHRNHTSLRPSDSGYAGWKEQKICERPLDTTIINPENDQSQCRKTLNIHANQPSRARTSTTYFPELCSGEDSTQLQCPIKQLRRSIETTNLTKKIKQNEWSFGRFTKTGSKSYCTPKAEDTASQLMLPKFNKNLWQVLWPYDTSEAKMFLLQLDGCHRQGSYAGTLYSSSVLCSTFQKVQLATTLREKG